MFPPFPVPMTHFIWKPFLKMQRFLLWLHCDWKRILSFTFECKEKIQYHLNQVFSCKHRASLECTLKPKFKQSKLGWRSFTTFVFKSWKEKFCLKQNTKNYFYTFAWGLIVCNMLSQTLLPLQSSLQLIAHHPQCLLVCKYFHLIDHPNLRFPKPSQPQIHLSLVQWVVSFSFLA